MELLDAFDFSFGLSLRENTPLNTPDQVYFIPVDGWRLPESADVGRDVFCDLLDF